MNVASAQNLPAGEVEHPALPGARGALSLLLGINFFNYVDRYVLAAVEPMVQRALFPGRDVNDAHVLTLMGSLSTVFIVSYMVVAPIVGWLADRTSRWLLIGCSVVLWSLATGGSGLATTFGMLFIMRMFVGVGEGGYGPTAPTIIADFYPVSRRGAVLSWFYMAIPLGAAIGYVLGELLSASFGWRWAFVGVMPPGLILGAMCFFQKEPPRGAIDSAEPAPRLRPADYIALLRNRSYVIDTAGMTAMTFAIGGISYWMPKYLTENPQAGSHVTVVFGLITAVAGIFATLLGGKAGDMLRTRFSGSYFLVSGVGLLLACPFIMLLTRSPFPLAWVWMFFAVFFLFFNTGPSNAILANVTHPSIRATAFAINILVLHGLGDATSPPLLGNIIGHFGWNGAFLTVTAVTAAGGLVWLFGARYLAEDTANAPHRPAL
jgi:MFS transporter, Spinster family, sphingosine-1-phosphate transporter